MRNMRIEARNNFQPRLSDSINLICIQPQTSSNFRIHENTHKQFIGWLCCVFESNRGLIDLCRRRDCVELCRCQVSGLSMSGVSGFDEYFTASYNCQALLDLINFSMHLTMAVKVRQLTKEIFETLQSMWKWRVMKITGKRNESREKGRRGRGIIRSR